MDNKMGPYEVRDGMIYGPRVAKGGAVDFWGVEPFSGRAEDLNEAFALGAAGARAALGDLVTNVRVLKGTFESAGNAAAAQMLAGWIASAEQALDEHLPTCKRGTRDPIANRPWGCTCKPLSGPAIQHVPVGA